MARAISKRPKFASKPWSAEELLILRDALPDYEQARRMLPHRSYYAIRHKAQKLGLRPTRHIWTGAEISRLRQIYPKGSQAVLRREFPGISHRHLAAIAQRHGIYRAAKPIKSTGYALLDEIRTRAAQKGISNSKLDRLARTKSYFHQTWWKANGLNYRHAVAAAEALGGIMVAVWED